MAGSPKIVKPIQGPPRYIVELYFKQPFEAVSTYHQSFSTQQSLWGQGKRDPRAENLNYKVTTSQDAFLGSTTAADAYKWPTPNKDKNAGKPTPWDESPEIERLKYMPFEDQTSYKAAYQASKTTPRT
ncbi:hypothetical protein GUITHDRAFT_116747 [Guillardia theta CCMP2712]|uniref:Uncharacterized protein n=1 Tax=Guillardia theta (strain CCMP2712) TaxID=905079 RepID=L1ILN8_GUITC|nr:hypothetical protein GUITHDRAFT_116747 [Guillardia theta CCMP2712]EKX37171.1 hypothetical protein GUITHDRAFT_116747 [Guillardia theta CCMP2712]|eukprot:XP_005824151.1 hypothetical protein GUITHDRAFT_116747 [Guillardia theta CCMP2712]